MLHALRRGIVGSIVLYFLQIDEKDHRISMAPDLQVYLGSMCTVAMPEFIDPVFARTSLKRSFSMSENERFGLVFAKTGSINSGTVLCTHWLRPHPPPPPAFGLIYEGAIGQPNDMYL